MKDREDDSSGEDEAVDYLARAAELSLRVGYRQTDVRDRITAEVRRSIATGHAGQAAWLVERNVDLLRRDQALSDETVDLLATAAREAASKGDRHEGRFTAQAAIALASASGRGEQAAELRTLIAASYEAEASERAAEGGLIASALLADALRPRE